MTQPAPAAAPAAASAAGSIEAAATAASSTVPALTPQQLQQLRDAEMDEHLSTIGLRRRQILKDGNCLFRVVAEAVYLSQAEHLRIRQECVAHVVANAEQFEPFLEQPLDHYAFQMRKSKEWGGHVELVAMAQRFKIDFQILQSPTLPAEFIRCASDSEAPVCVRLCFCNGNHYDALYPIAMEETLAFCQQLVFELVDKAIDSKYASSESFAKYRNFELEAWTLAQSQLAVRDRELVAKLEARELKNSLFSSPQARSNGTNGTATGSPSSNKQPRNNRSNAASPQAGSSPTIVADADNFTQLSGYYQKNKPQETDDGSDSAWQVSQSKHQRKHQAKQQRQIAISPQPARTATTVKPPTTSAAPALAASDQPAAAPSVSDAASFPSLSASHSTSSTRKNPASEQGQGTKAPLSYASLVTKSVQPASKPASEPQVASHPAAASPETETVVELSSQMQSALSFEASSPSDANVASVAAATLAAVDSTGGLSLSASSNPNEVLSPQQASRPHDSKSASQMPLYFGDVLAHDSPVEQALPTNPPVSLDSSGDQQAPPAHPPSVAAESPAPLDEAPPASTTSVAPLDHAAQEFVPAALQGSEYSPLVDAPQFGMQSFVQSEGYFAQGQQSFVDNPYAYQSNGSTEHFARHHPAHHYAPIQQQFHPNQASQYSQFQQYHQPQQFPMGPRYPGYPPQSQMYFVPSPYNPYGGVRPGPVAQGYFPGGQMQPALLPYPPHSPQYQQPPMNFSSPQAPNGHGSPYNQQWTPHHPRRNKRDSHHRSGNTNSAKQSLQPL
ncbi:hypothetical protein CAOG_00665 [Capsaspora owczarzaki ATCC 30864]|uniref:OTU domain-containing protein n=1 Tax=Capsaspora owczarzaki (strain ATCC 30864) TaxID=595528 RepID=A0A0D2U1T3_CAPO3|nr:hypothetical protein CAOG_00665 [Capsaspora owczarzaki ATCC 30864]KJE89131.1 hypothetical protein CAOG_000665 [Capsaspora owczarzaki ATCC 30864]|eukprot:XP_004365536.1 hypothetical protein CAOG_00665 [Capsaspora owczarzaki ATCC 30864]